MSKPKINLLRLIITVLIGAALYAMLMQFLLKTGWRFDMTNRAHWEFAINKWNRGWVIKETKDVLFFCLMLSFFPGWIITTAITYSFPYKDFFLFPITLLKRRKNRQLMKQSLALASGAGQKNKPAAPAATKKKQTKSNPLIDKLRGRQVAGGTAAAATPSSPASTASSSASTSASSNKTPEEIQLEHLQRWNEVATDLEESDVFCFRSTKIGSFAVKLTVLTKNAIFWFIEGPLQPDVWTLKDDTKGIWQGEKEQIPSPLRLTSEAREQFRQHLKENSAYDDVMVHAFVVMDAGELENPEKITTDLAQYDVAVLKMPPCTDDNLSDLSTVISYIKGLEASDMAFNDAVAESIMALEED